MPQSNGPVNPDENYDPEKGKSAVWLNAIAEAKKTYRDWQDYTDQIEKFYADLQKLADDGTQDRELQIFWATLQVIMPSIYSREPVPVVAPRFKDRRPLYQVSAEFLERAAVTGINLSCMNDVMKGVRDDLCLGGRGVIWVCYDTKSKKKTGYSEKTYPEWLDRMDFLHEPARKWAEVGWAAKGAWLTYDEMKERFKDKWDKLDGLVFKVLRDLRVDGGATAEPKCQVWEIWSKTHNKVVWVTEGVEETLEESEPYLELEYFFPCPKPAFDTLQPRTVIPVPMFLQIKGQVEEINELTDRIHKLSEAIKVKAFYQGGSEIGDAIEAGLATLSNHKLMIPISNIGALTQGAQGSSMVYWPVDVVAEVVNGLVLLRNEIINNIYQIIGISDIMRGSTEKDETATAQQIKAEFGSVRVRDKQAELVRIARDTVAIMAEIMAEHFSQETLLAMTQMEIPTDAEIKAQVKPLEQQARDIPKQAEAQAKQIMQQAKQQAQQAANNPEMMQQAQQNPEQAQQMLQQAMAQVEEQVQGIAQQAQDAVADIMEQIAKLQGKPTIEKVMKFLRDNKMRCFVLDIETDSTVAADEQMEKQQRTEFVTALGGMVNQFGAVIQTMPQLTPLFGGLLKFALAPYRVGRELDGLIDEAIDALTQQGQQPPPENPDAIKAKAEAEKMTGEMELKAKEDMRKQQMHEADIKAKEAVTQAELQSKAAVTKIQIDTTTALADQKGKIDASLYAKQIADMNAAEARAAAAHQRDMEMKALDIQAKKVTIAANAQQADIKKQQGEQTIAVTAEKAKAERNKPTNGAR